MLILPNMFQLRMVEKAKKSAAVYSVIGLVFVFLGTLMSNDLVWELSDMFNNLMVIPNTLALFALTGMVLKTTHGVGIKK